MDRRQARRSVSMKLILSMTTSILVASAVAGVALVTEHNVRRELTREMETRLVLEARNLALLSTDALLAEFPELTLCPLVREMVDRQPDITLAVVLDHEGLVQGYPDPRALGHPFADLSHYVGETPQGPLNDGEALIGNDVTIAVRAEVRHANGQMLGTVVVGQPRDQLTAVLAANRRQVLGLAALLAVAGGLVAIMLMRRLLRPVDALRRGLERIGEGDLESPIQLEDGTELGLLANTVNAMAGQLMSSRHEALAKELEIVQTQQELIHTLGIVVEGRSHETANHTIRVGHATALLAALAGLGQDEAELLRMAAPMHDVGKVGIPDAILNKPGKLTDDEFNTMKSHAEIGYNILNHSERPLLKSASIIAHEHHERWDGKGYPRGIRGDDIHIYGRIVSIVDVFDALSSNRVYRAAMPMSRALAIMEEGHGTQFDPHLLDIFLSNIDRFRALMDVYSDVFESPERIVEKTLSPIEESAGDESALLDPVGQA